MRILVVGGTGFIGPHVVRHLVAAGHEVTVFHRGQHEPDLPRDVRHVHSPSAAFPIIEFPPELLAWRPEIVLHMVAMGERDAEAAVRTFRRLARRFVVCSSGDVYAAYGVLIGTEDPMEQSHSLSEGAPLRRNLYPYRKMAKNSDDWLYHYEKVLVERVVMSDPELQGTVLRLPAVYGPGDNRHRFFLYLKRMDDGRSAILLDRDHARWRWTHGYVENVASAIARAVLDDRAACRIYNIGEEVTPSTEERLQALIRITAWSGRIVKISHHLLPQHLQDAYNYSCDLAYDTSRIRSELGYQEHISTEEGMRRTIADLRAHPPRFDPREYDYATEDAVLAGEFHGT
jgi:nucleoside-diphosphate-sugar epimerase